MMAPVVWTFESLNPSNMRADALADCCDLAFKTPAAAVPPTTPAASLRKLRRSLPQIRWYFSGCKRVEFDTITTSCLCPTLAPTEVAMINAGSGCEGAFASTQNDLPDQSAIPSVTVSRHPRIARAI